MGAERDERRQQDEYGVSEDGGALGDLARTKAELATENAFLVSG